MCKVLKVSKGTNKETELRKSAECLSVLASQTQDLPNSLISYKSKLNLYRFWTVLTLFLDILYTRR